METPLQHIGIIMDGNRRWAKDNSLPTLEGYDEGERTLSDIVDHCKKRGISVLTVFAFSTENWKRTPDEVKYLMDLFSKMIRDRAERLIQEHVRVQFIGDLSEFSPTLHKAMLDLMEKTKDHTSFTFNIAVNYGGRAEILNAIRCINKAGIDPNTLTEEEFSNYLYTAGLPDPDLIIRTSGEQRLSNFLTWQSAYSEFYFIDIHWPDFTPTELDKAIEDYTQRQRRFGK
ncbi:MAG: polyprenyl diphosphate synthase [Patescibacteria group bacterium]